MRTLQKIWAHTYFLLWNSVSWRAVTFQLVNKLLKETRYGGGAASIAHSARDQRAPAKEPRTLMKLKGQQQGQINNR